MSHINPNSENEPLNRSLLTGGDFVTNEPIDLTNCDKEPIHIPGMIQPNGVLLAARRTPTGKIVQCSRNSGDLLGRTPDELLGTPLVDLIGQEVMMDLVKRDLNAVASSDLQYLKLLIEVDGLPVRFTAVAHESEGLLILELELETDDNAEGSEDFHWIRNFFVKLKQTSNRYAASQVAAEQVKEILGYDRVMIYEFDKEWNGKVVAEAKKPELEPFLGHHYPASDIPKQARALYLRNWLRTIVDVDYTPVEIVPTVQPLTGRPLNLSLSVLRSVSPMHIEYLKNMGVYATVTISLIHDGRLWGMITCHHYSPKYVTHRIRNLCNFLGAFFSNELYQRQQLDEYQAELRLRTEASRIAKIFTANSSPFHVVEDLYASENRLLQMMSASGAAVSYNDKLLLFGDTPAPGQVRELAGWMGGKAKNYAHQTSRLSLEFSPAAAYKAKASGALYVALSPGQQNYIIWFRPEVLQVVDWAGDPAKAVIQEDDGIRLSPRKSFEKWRQVVQGTALEWKTEELNALIELRAVVDNQTKSDLQRAEEQALQNSRMLRQNEQRYLQLMEYSPVAFFTITDRHIVYCNEQAAKLLGEADKEELIGLDFLPFVLEESREPMRRLLLQLEKDASALVSGSQAFVNVNCEQLQLDITLAAVSHSGRPSIMLIARQAAGTEEQQTEYISITDQLSSYMTTDPLTDLPNRRAFEERIEQDWLAAPENGASPIALLEIDIDDFRAYNAVHGLQGGDLCIQSVAQVLDLFGRQYEASVSRFGGGTFMLRLDGEHAERAEDLAEQLREGVLGLQMSRDEGRGGDYVTVSIGGTVMRPTPEHRFTHFIAQADRAMMKAKREGKNRVVFLKE
ncbi:sensor domain-containing diguanylate cyclase [Saccharibacillus alkalitolerans]|uniref:Diguanylate cyclase n=1 Tax=Saccharibacillus alkalitolerans TaxID=2705290 RepID=A0ABX0F6E8_9BACL|nr:sensor domain-containing diguanylate cyclase [Saccharibacillus alkalitolerans]NGZ74741.1 diguanylate cyclase [Saccharibacillus alkalitolerans]